MPRVPLPLHRERQLWVRGLARVAGVDEVGRGPLAGPVVAAAVVIRPDHAPIEGVADSKRVGAAERARLAERIRAEAAAWGVGAASVAEIDRLNIRRATALAMQRAIAALGAVPDHLLVDGRPVPELGHERQTAVIGGDAQVYSIACASLVAKVCRDALMTRLARRHPAYGWDRNAGYGTPEHLAALRANGVSAHHRRSFAPVRVWIQGAGPGAESGA